MFNEERLSDEQLQQLLVQWEEQKLSAASLLAKPAIPEQASDKFSKMRNALELLHYAGRSQSSDSSSTKPWLSEQTSDVSTAEGAPSHRYTFIRRLGQGGFGIVFLARDAQLNRNVAVKLPRLDIFLTKHMVQRFLREAQNVAKLNHPNIVPVLAIDDTSPMPSIVYHFCDGPTLAHWLKSSPEPVSATTVAKIGLLLADAVQHAHSRGVLHRDLKPSNILLEPATDKNAPHGFYESGTHWIPRIIDFGISKAMQDDSVDTMTTGLVGTTEYMPPEQLSGRMKDIGTHSDVYSLGVILYELLTKARPFGESSAVDILIKMRSSAVPSVRKRRLDVSRDLDAIITRCLDKDESHRYPTASELAADLRNYLDNKPVSVRSQTRLQRLASWSRRQPLVATLSVACVLLLCFGLAATSEYIRRSNLLVIQLSETNKELKAAMTKAEHAEREANAHAKNAERNARDLRVELYAADVSAAYQAQQDGDLTLYHTLLDRQIVLSDEVEDLRDLAWSYLWQKSHRPHLRIPASASPIYSLKFANSNSSAALCGADGMLRVFDLTDHSESRAWNAGQSELNSAVFSDDDRYLASAGDDGTVCIWEAFSGRLLNQFRAHPEQAHHVLFGPEDTLITSGNEPTIRIWNWRSGSPEGILERHHKSVQSIALSKDRKRLFSAADDATICIWQLDTKSLIAQSEAFEARNIDIELSSTDAAVFWADISGIARRANSSDAGDVQQLTDLTDHAQSIAVSPNGRRIAVASREGAIAIVDLNEHGSPIDSLEQISKWVAHRGRIYDLAFSADGSTLHSVGEDGNWRVWNPALSPPSVTLNVDDIVKPWKHFGLAFDQFDDDSCIFAVDSKIFRWNSVSNAVKQLAATKEPASRLIVCGKEGLVVTGHVDGEVNAWRFQTTGLERLWHYSWQNTPESIGGLTYCSSQNAIAIGIKGADAIRLLDVENGREIKRLTIPKVRGHDTDGRLLCSPDGKWLAAAMDKEVVVWNLHDETTTRLTGHTNMVSSLCFHPGSLFLISGSDDRTLRLWNLETGTSLAELRHHKDRVTSIVMSPDGRTFLTTDNSGATSVWHTVARKLLFELDVEEGEACLAANWSGQNLFRRGSEILLHADYFDRNYMLPKQPPDSP